MNASFKGVELPEGRTNITALQLTLWNGAIADKKLREKYF